MTPLDEAVAHVRRAELHEAREAQRQRILSFVDERTDVLWRSCREGHFTASAMVVEPSGRFLLLFHAKLRRWLQPGGHADGDGALHLVAFREASEETGIAGLRVHEPALDVEVHMVAPPSEPAHLHLDVRFLVTAPAGARALINHESLALRWVGSDELSELTDDPGIALLAERALARSALI